MLKVGVTVGCVAAMLVAAAITIWLRDTRRTPSPLTGSEPFGERLSVTISRTGGMLVGAYVAGVLTIGAGIRLMMRVLAATSSDEAQGRFTDADEVVGKVSLDGSLFLIVIGGIGSASVGLALFAILRRWLPDQSLMAGLIGVAIGGGVFVRPVGLLTADNPDFTLVAPVALAVALCVVTLVLFGATFGVLVDNLAARWPRPGRSLVGVISVLPFVVLLLSPPALAVVIIAVLVGVFAPRLRSLAKHDHSERPDGGGAVTRFGRSLVLTIGAVGILSILVAAVQVLTL